MKLKKGMITHNMMGQQMMVAVGDATKTFNGMVKSNGTASFIIECLKTDTTKEEILGKVLDQYEVDEDTAMQDIEKVIATLDQIGVLDA